jgi:hypothetical protein
VRTVDLLAELQTKHQFRDILGGHLPRHGHQGPNPERAAGLKLLEARRRDGERPAVLRDERGESWGCAMVAIPMLDFQVHCVRNPELRSKDRETRNRAWHKFFREFGRMYGCDDSIGQQKRNTGIIVR